MHILLYIFLAFYFSDLYLEVISPLCLVPRRNTLAINIYFLCLFKTHTERRTYMRKKMPRFEREPTKPDRPFSLVCEDGGMHTWTMDVVALFPVQASFAHHAHIIYRCCVSLLCCCVPETHGHIPRADQRDALDREWIRIGMRQFY